MKHKNVYQRDKNSPRRYCKTSGNKNGKNASENVNICCENALRLSVILLMAYWKGEYLC